MRFKIKKKALTNIDGHCVHFEAAGKVKAIE